MFNFSISSTGGNTEHTASSSDRSYEADQRSIEDGCSDDGSSAPSPSFQLPMYLSSPATTPDRQSQTSLVQVPRVSSNSSGSSSSSPTQEEQRLVLLAKHPNANEAMVQQSMERQRRKEELANAAAMKKGQQFRRQQQLHEDQKQRRRQLQQPPQRLSRNMESLIEESSSEEESVELAGKQIVFQEPSNSRSLSRHSKAQSNDDAASFVVWQVAGQGTGEKLYKGTPQRITFEEELPPPPTYEQPFYREKRRGIMGLTVNMLENVFKIGSSKQAPSSAASIFSDSLDGRSVNTANKSLGSKASLPSHCSEKTRKINNLTPKDRAGKSMESIDECCGENNRSGFRRLLSSRNGLIILMLCLVLIIALIVTAIAAVNGGKRSQPSNSIAGEPSFSGPAPTQTPTIGPPGVSIPPIPTNASTTPTLLADAISSPTEAPITTASVPAIPEATSSPTLPPSLSPSASPTLDNFSEWTWIQQGLSLKGGEEGERFGQTVAISEDGKILAVGSPYATVDGNSLVGTVQIFQWDETDRRGWISHGLLQGRNKGDQFGSNIALSYDGIVIAVSEPTFRGKSGDRTGNIRTFVQNPFNGYSPLGQELEGVDATDHFGIGLSLSTDGRRIAVGAPYHDNTGKSDNGSSNGSNSKRLVSGHARVFEWSSENGRWMSIGQPMAGTAHLDWFGWSVDLNDDGSILCVGAPRNLEFGGYVQCYEEGNSGVWMMLGGPIENGPTPDRYDDNFGAVVKVSHDSTGSKHRVAIGSPGKDRNAVDAGVAVVYEYDSQFPSSGWTQLGQIMESPSPTQANRFAASLDIQGDVLAIGAPGAGEVNLFRFQRESSVWERHPRTLQGLAGSSFGTDVKLTPFGDVVVGSPQSGASDDTGTVNVFSVEKS